MLVLKCKRYRHFEAAARSGDIFWFRVYHISSDFPSRVIFVFDDAARNFSLSGRSDSSRGMTWPL